MPRRPRPDPSLVERWSMGSSRRRTLMTNLFEPREPERPRGSIATSVRGESRRDAKHAFEPSRHPPVPAAEERDQGRNEERADDGRVEQDAGGQAEGEDADVDVRRERDRGEGDAQDD